ncbi:hypothetical protein AKJ57_04260 [candidate division MSBL1 archaeon SCGC-AAA259A05]|uniref:NH(3)-dependent NAD(+) synthetase n=1 Tax=candidate division MSBL1 archaeon SCGC-AAA259A05 TaxID=1698259 RepID=A0A133U812_9EURY|nr:hypothetical protein AKJ57_04260 [candidate division MSBL1 archaeon SCGC-AAA259A05]
MGNNKKIEKILEIDARSTVDKIKNFIQNKVKEAGSRGAVLGLSGGLDSSTAAFLCSKALKDRDVLAISMPEKGITDPQNVEDSERIAKDLGIKFQKIEISPIFEKIKEEIGSGEEKKNADGNLKARIRMIILYYHSNLFDYLVVGTSNKSELKCGYFTKYGDGAADLLPLGALYKTQVRKIAKEIGVPQDIIDKTPSAELWRGQKDSQELGLTYDKIDKIYAGLEAELSEKEIVEAVNVPLSTAREFNLRKKNSKHKLQSPPTPAL